MAEFSGFQVETSITHFNGQAILSPAALPGLLTADDNKPKVVSINKNETQLSSIASSAERDKEGEISASNCYK